ncbi:hypothetical protein JYU14_05380, partial [Simkania negevensis]|nr:hypothetical protein [Simkania negevensis]
ILMLKLGSFMQIIHSSKSFFHPLLPYEEAGKHLRVAFVRSEKCCDLVKKGVLFAGGDGKSLSLLQRVKHLTLAVLKAIPLLGHLVALVHRAIAGRQQASPSSERKEGIEKKEGVE